MQRRAAERATWQGAFVAIITVLTLLTGCSGGGPAPGSTPTKSAVPLDPSIEIESAASAFYRAIEQVGASGGDDTSPFLTVAMGDALQDLEQAADSWRRLGIRIEGRREVNVLDVHADGAYARVSACVDDNTFRFRSDEGDDPESDYGVHRVLLDLTSTDGTWLVSDFSLAEEAC